MPNGPQATRHQAARHLCSPSGNACQAYMMTTSSSLTAAGIAFDVGFKRGGALLLSATRAAALLLAAPSVPTEPLGSGQRPPNLWSASNELGGRIGWRVRGALGCAPDLGTCSAPADLLVVTCMLIWLRNGSSLFKADSFAVSRWTVSSDDVALFCWMILCRVDIPLPSRPIPQLVQKHQHNPL